MLDCTYVKLLRAEAGAARVRTARTGVGCGRLFWPGAPGQVRGAGATPASCWAVVSPFPRPPSSALLPEKWVGLVQGWGQDSSLLGGPDWGMGSPGLEGVLMDSVP